MDIILGGFLKAGRAAFRTREFTALRGRGAYARLVLHRLAARGGLVQARRGWWAFPYALPEAVACEVSKPAFVSYHSALFLRGLTTQTPRAVQLAVGRNAKRYAILGTPVREFNVGKGRFNHYSRQEGVLLASPEKAVADCLEKPRACPDIVLVEALKSVPAQNVRELLSSNAARKRLNKVMRLVGSS